MPITSRAGLLGFLLALSTLSLPTTPASAAGTSPAPPDQGQPATKGDDVDAAGNHPITVDDRLRRLAAAIRERERGIDASLRPLLDQQLAMGFVNGGRAGWGNTAYRGGFVNGHPYYGRPGFVNGGGGFVNGGHYGGGSFVNSRYPGTVFRNW